jgi:hypothetical protein
LVGKKATGLFSKDRGVLVALSNGAPNSSIGSLSRASSRLKVSPDGGWTGSRAVPRWLRLTQHQLSEWSPMVADPLRDKAELDGLMRAFLGAFDNTGGRRPNVDVVCEVFIPQGIISTDSSYLGRRSSPTGR